MFSFMKAVTFGLFHQTQKGETALHLACNEGHYEVVRLLLQAPALLNIVDEVLMQNQIVFSTARSRQQSASLCYRLVILHSSWLH